MKFLDGLTLGRITMNTGIKIVIGKAKDQYWGLFVAPLSIYSVDRKLLYRRKNYKADPIYKNGPDSDPVYFNFSAGNNYLYFRERNRTDINDLWDSIYNIESGKIKRIPFGSFSAQEILTLEKEAFDLNQFPIWTNTQWEDAPKYRNFVNSIFRIY